MNPEETHKQNSFYRLTLKSLFFTCFLIWVYVAHCRVMEDHLWSHSHWCCHTLQTVPGTEHYPANREDRELVFYCWSQVMPLWLARINEKMCTDLQILPINVGKFCLTLAVDCLICFWIMSSSFLWRSRVLLGWGTIIMWWSNITMV